MAMAFSSAAEQTDTDGVRDGGERESSPCALPADAASAAAPLFRRERFVLRGFSRTTDVLEASRLCRAADVACRLVPRPASLGNAECGTALRTLPADEARVCGLLADAGIEPDGIVEAVDYV